MDRRAFVKGCASGAIILAVGACSEKPSLSARDAGPASDAESDDLEQSDAGRDSSPNGDAAPSGDQTISDSGPLPIDADAPPQFLTWDGGSGPNNRYWSEKLKLRWKHAEVGDWLDADGSSQGERPYALAEVSALGGVSVEITSLVSRWVTTGENRGAYLITDEAWAFYFIGRTSADAAKRPTLSVETDQGIFTAPCTCNAMWTKTSAYGVDSRERFSADSGNTRAILRFDLDGVVGVVQSATLSLHCDELKYPGKLRVFEADPPIFRVAGGPTNPLQGIAEGFEHDLGLAAHASVLFASDFEEVSAPDWIGTCALQEQLPDADTQSIYLRGGIPEGQLLGSNLRHDVVRADVKGGAPTGVEKELYARYYVYLERDWGSTRDANKMPGWDMRLGWWNPASGGYWAPISGNGGYPGTGKKVYNEAESRWEYHGHSLRGHGGEAEGDGNPYDELFWLGGYIYHLDQKSDFGDALTWSGVVIGKERWVCIEQYVKVNSISGPFDEVGNGTAEADGIYRVWVDGVQTYERTGMRWSRHPELGLQGFWLNWYHGGTAKAPQTMHFRMNHVAIAREYIGPRKG